MKRKVTYPNGVVEEMEGTPEEFQKLGAPQYPFTFYPAVVVPFVIPYTAPTPVLPYEPWQPTIICAGGIPQDTIFSGTLSTFGCTSDNGSILS